MWLFWNILNQDQEQNWDHFKTNKFVLFFLLLLTVKVSTWFTLMKLENSNKHFLKLFILHRQHLFLLKTLLKSQKFLFLKGTYFIRFLAPLFVDNKLVLRLSSKRRLVKARDSIQIKKRIKLIIIVVLICLI